MSKCGLRIWGDQDGIHWHCIDIGVAGNVDDWIKSNPRVQDYLLSMHYMLCGEWADTFIVRRIYNTVRNEWVDSKTQKGILDQLGL